METKHDRFKRLARLRGERILNDLRLLGNLANRNNYEYSDSEVKALFSAIDEELKIARFSFERNKKRKIEFK